MTLMKLAPTLALAIFLVGLSTSAQVIAPGTEPKVIYFGGYGATPQQMKCWKQGVTSKNLNAHVSVSAIPYPRGASSGLNREVENLSEYQALLSEIKANPKRKFVVGGHSSGSQYANNLVEWMLSNGVDSKQIELVNLDGFSANQNLRNKVKVTCWSASGGGTVSNNYSSGCKVHKEPNCSTKWCLHFSLVNHSTPSNLGGGGDFIERGYSKNDCQTNVEWIRQALPPPPAGMLNGKMQDRIPPGGVE